MCGQCDASDDLMEPYDEWKLNRLVSAFEEVQKATVDYETALRLQGHAREVRTWLGAEAYWKVAVDRWLEAEKKWHNHQAFVRNDPVYQAAERGWLAMRESAPRLDGVDTFPQLADILQSRYYAFAKAVLDQQEN